MKIRYTITIVCLSVLLVTSYFNWKYEVIAINPFGGEEERELTIMTWNVHCSEGANDDRQRKIAELILNEDADFVQLNEYNQKRCTKADSLIKTRYQYIEECRSHRKSGDIFYSKCAMSNSGHVYIPNKSKHVQTIKATIAIGGDSVQIFGVHMASNHYNENDEDCGELEKEKSAYARYKKAQTLRCFQAEWTKVEISKSKHPVILMGDMNDFNQSKPLKILCSCDLVESWWEGGNGYGHTFHDGWLRLRIDHILHSKELKLKSIKVIYTELSDHNPVVAGFSVSK